MFCIIFLWDFALSAVEPSCVAMVRLEISISSSLPTYTSPQVALVPIVQVQLVPNSLIYLRDLLQGYLLEYSRPTLGWVE